LETLFALLDLDGSSERNSYVNYDFLRVCQLKVVAFLFAKGRSFKKKQQVCTAKDLSSCGNHPQINGLSRAGRAEEVPQAEKMKKVSPGAEVSALCPFLPPPHSGYMETEVQVPHE
jgi:hypothetical protein